MVSAVVGSSMASSMSRLSERLGLYRSYQAEAGVIVEQCLAGDVQEEDWSVQVNMVQMRSSIQNML